MVIFAFVMLTITVGEGAAEAVERPRMPALLPMDDPPKDTDPGQGEDGWLPGSGDNKCRHQDSTLYVPRDIDGYAFNWYCRNGEKGVYRRRFAKKVNGDHANITELKDYAAKKSELNGKFTFDKLADEPCDAIDIDGDTDLERSQCARIKSEPAIYTKDEKGKQKGPLKPCEQWEKIIRDLAEKKKAQPFVSTDLENISYCNSENPIFQKVFKVMTRADPNKDYNVNDYTGPESLVKPLGSLLSIGVWLAMATSVIGVLICAGKLALAYRGGAEEPVTGIIVVLVACVMAGSAIGITKMMLTG